MTTDDLPVDELPASDLAEKMAEALALADALAGHAHTAAEAVWAINHLTILGPALPAPDLYRVLGPLTRLGHGLAQAYEQLAVGLDRSAAVYQLTEDDPNRDPLTSIGEGGRWLDIAAEHARNLGAATGRAHVAIAGQGHHGARTPGADR